MLNKNDISSQTTRAFRPELEKCCDNWQSTLKLQITMQSSSWLEAKAEDTDVHGQGQAFLRPRLKARDFCLRGVFEVEDSPRGPHPCYKPGLFVQPLDIRVWCAVFF